jgi:hypothetical protein
LHPSLEYLFIAGAISVVLNFRYHLFSGTYVQLSGLWPEDGKSYANFFGFAEQNPTFVNIVAIPVFTLFTRLFFPGKTYNLAELLIVNTYIAAQQLLGMLLMLPFFWLLPSQDFPVVINSYYLLSFLYNFWVLLTFFEGHWLLTALRSLMSLLLSYLLQFFVNLLLYFGFKPYLDLLNAF